MYFHHLREPGNYRAWLHYGKGSAKAARFELSWRSRLTGLRFGHDDEVGWHASVGLWLVYWAFSVDVPKWLRPRHRPGDWSSDVELSLTLHSGAIWWRLWRNPHEWTSSVPRWREGSFNVVDFLLGPTTCEERVIDEMIVPVPMPERSYEANAKLIEFSWRRPRWFTKRLLRVSIDVPEGIPFPGKGENSWDCGDDATYSMTTGECRSIPEGVGQLVGSVLKRRVRYGGWDDYVWKKLPPNDPITPLQPVDGAP